MTLRRMVDAPVFPPTDAEERCAPPLTPDIPAAEARCTPPLTAEPEPMVPARRTAVRLLVEAEDLVAIEAAVVLDVDFVVPARLIAEEALLILLL